MKKNPFFKKKKKKEKKPLFLTIGCFSNYVFLAGRPTGGNDINSKNDINNKRVNTYLIGVVVAFLKITQCF